MDPGLGTGKGKHSQEGAPMWRVCGRQIEASLGQGPEPSLPLGVWGCGVARRTLGHSGRHLGQPPRG